jgi:hypothetical protein
MRATLVLSLSACLASSMAQAPTSIWQKVEDPIGRYVAYFPTKPTPLTRELNRGGENLTLKGYVSAQREGAQMVMFMDLPRNTVAGDEKQILAAMIAYIKAGEKYKITNEQDFKLGAYPAKRLWIDLEGKGQMLNNVILVKNRMYQVAVVGPNGSLASEQTDKFFTSFKLK